MVYIHIPYCRTHCTYCAFYSELLPRSGSSDAFVDALCRELASFRPSQALLNAPHTLYIGGGTPSLLPPAALERIVGEVVKAGWQIEGEFTLEVNPDDIVRGGEAYAATLKALGVSRISMGIQSGDDAQLRLMGRRHNFAEALDAYRMLRRVGFDNISVDFIFGFAEGPAEDDIRASLMELDSAGGSLPEHISCYQLSVEPGSALEKMRERGLWEMPSDEMCCSQYSGICSMLAALGYEHYEISNWARPGRRSLHNSSYWTHQPYMGFGPGAHSFVWDGQVPCRYWNEPSLHSYLTRLVPERSGERLSPEQLRLERIMLGLRTCDGIDASLIDGEYSFLEPCSGGRLRIPESEWFISDSLIAGID